MKKHWGAIAGIMYLVIVAIVLAVIADRRNDLRCIGIAYRATRALPKNHRIVDTDLRIPRAIPRRLRKMLPEKKDLVGKYLRCAVPLDARIDMKKLSETPLLNAARGLGLVTFKINDPAICASLEPRDRVDLYVKAFGPKPDAEGRVIALFGTTVPCSAVLEVPPAQGNSFTSPAKLFTFTRGTP